MFVCLFLGELNRVPHPSCPRASTEQRTERDTQGWEDRLVHRVKESLYCEPWCLHITRYSQGKSQPCGYLHSEQADSYSTHTEVGWYLRTFRMVYCGDGSNWKSYLLQLMHSQSILDFSRWTSEAQRHWKQWLTLWTCLCRDGKAADQGPYTF